MKVAILFSVADLIPSCTHPKVIRGVYSHVSFPFLNFLDNFHFPGPSLAPPYLHQCCVVGTTVSAGCQPRAVGNVQIITISDGLSPSCGCWPSGSQFGGCFCSFGGINDAFASHRDVSLFLSSAEMCFYQAGAAADVHLQIEGKRDRLGVLSLRKMASAFTRCCVRRARVAG